jgi:hypothetical protein
MFPIPWWKKTVTHVDDHLSGKDNDTPPQSNDFEEFG